jgi:hypothetical protein
MHIKGLFAWRPLWSLGKDRNRPEWARHPHLKDERHSMNRGPIDRPKSVWFVALVALFVGLGVQELLENIVPADFASWPFGTTNHAVTMQFVTSDSSWMIGTMIRVLSFAMAGLVAVLLVGALTGRLLSTLLVVAILATVFEQFPIGSNAVVVASWFLAAPSAIAAGAWLASARRADGTRTPE